MIIADNEIISPLHSALVPEGFETHVVRRNYSSDELRMPRAIKCLLNHYSAWQYVVQTGEPALIVEADFVPCRGISQFPMPYNPDQQGAKISYVYAAGPVVYHHGRNDGYWGHACTTVAYTVNPEAADLWLQLLDEYRVKRNFQHYIQWDVEMPIDLKHHKGIRLYISEKDYGEHGGIPNPEHKLNGITTWHQAASLMAPLAFMPLYARGSALIFFFFRARSRARYIYKFAVGKYFDNWQTFMKIKPDRGKKLLFAFRRTFL
ncbi:MAG: hypothetical protein ACKO8I_00660 [Cyanobacteriota bacterium]